VRYDTLILVYSLASPVEVSGGREHHVVKEDNIQKGEKREAILQAALELVAENGLQHTPMSLISKRSGASAGIIYHYFESKEDLLESLYWRIKKDKARALVASDDPRQPLAKRFQTLWLSIFRYCLSHPQEMAFLEQYASVPRVKQHGALLHGEAKTLDDLIEKLRTQDAFKDLPLEEKTLFSLIVDLRAQDLVKDLPLEVIGEFTEGMALRLASQVNADQMSLDEAMLNEIAKACWDAIAR
jgi:TetR/AcrR family transcriptional regulator, repressor of fatR-cypB operon